jgi:ComF family protein
MGRKLAESMMHEGKRPAIDLIVPIPLHWTRHRQRGYNQSFIISSPIGNAISVPVMDDIMYRKRRTRDQTGLSAAERALNLRGAFALRKSDAVIGSRVLLVDDVTTTGATLSEAAKTLLEAGCRSVTAAVVAAAGR